MKSCLMQLVMTVATSALYVAVGSQQSEFRDDNSGAKQGTRALRE